MYSGVQHIFIKLCFWVCIMVSNTYLLSCVFWVCIVVSNTYLLSCIFVLFFFVLCTICWQFVCIVHFSLLLRYTLTFICNCGFVTWTDQEKPTLSMYRVCFTVFRILFFIQCPGGSVSYVVGLPNNTYKPITNTAWVCARLCTLQKRVQSTRSRK